MSDCPCYHCQLRRLSHGIVVGIITAVAIFAVVAMLTGCSLVTKTYDIHIYQYGSLDNSVSAEVLKEQQIEPSVRLK